MIVLGINAFHGDSAAALLRDGEIVAAVEEERFRRIKHWAGFPSHSIRFCLGQAGIDLSSVDHVAVNQDSAANLRHKLAFALSRRPEPGLILDRLRARKRRKGALEWLRTAFPGESLQAELHFVEHHLAHLASAFHCSGFESAAVVSVDGFGDFASSAWGVGQGRDIQVDGRILFPHSLGIFYQALTQYLGFPAYGDEYKVMGLAAYGRPGFMPEMRRLVRLAGDGTFRLGLEFFRHHTEKIDYTWESGPPRVSTLYTPALVGLLGPDRASTEPIEARHEDIARSVQAMYEEAFFHLLRRVHDSHPLDRIAVAGGCGMNSVANGKVRSCTPFRKLFVQAAAGDAGGALGAAQIVHCALGSEPRHSMGHAMWGPEITDQEIEAALDARRGELSAAGCRIGFHARAQALCDEVVSRLVGGGVVGWCQGRMEWGPRALGNRSILADPRREDMKGVLNAKIKQRESFRPFAPSILREYVGEWFEEDDHVPFMTETLTVREEKRASIPAVTHVDGSGRLQTVDRDTQPLFWQLIETFARATGVPMLLNTSFNENEPIVCSAGEALDCFLRTRMDMLVLGKWAVIRAVS